MTTQLNKKTILIIEDDNEISFTLKLFLEGEGYKVLIGDNGLEALEIMKKSNTPDLILLDMKMPVMNGWEFAIEFINKYDHICPIIVMTAAADAQKRAQDINAIGWVAKPFDLDDLLAKVKLHERKNL